MNIKTNSGILIPVLLLFYFSACDSSSYEMEEVEILTDTTGIARNDAIKQEIDKPKPEIKEDVKKEDVKKEEATFISKSPGIKYTVQIGAYEVESNAQEMINKAKSFFGVDVYSDLKGSLFKVRIGNLDSTDEAIALLLKIKKAGFYDAFITQVDK